MSHGIDVSADSLNSAAELAVLVELEAQWENLRMGCVRAPEMRMTGGDLQSIQKAYEAFRVKLTAYNKRHTPKYVPEVLLNTLVRLGDWCRAMRDLYLQVEQHPQVRCPVQILKKAQRWADRVADKMGRARLVPPTAPADIRGAIVELENMARWCESEGPLAAAA